MKNLIYTLLFLLFSAPVFQAKSQTATLCTANSIEQNATQVKSIESKYFNGKVYLHFTINGNIETKTVAVERSLDATNYEVIGYIKIYGTNVLCDLAYYFTDESPVSANLYYRLSDYSLNNEPAYSETTSVTPIDETKAPSDIVTTIPNTLAITPICDEEILVGASN